MTYFHPAWVEHQRRHWMRPDAERFVRPDAHRFMPPGAPRWSGKDAVRYFWPEHNSQTSRARHDETAQERDVAFLRELVARREDLLRLRRELAAINAELKFRRFFRSLKAGFNPSQPRVPRGSPDGGQWTGDGGAGGGGGAGGEAPGAEGTTRKPEVVRDHTGEQPWETIVNEYGTDGSIARQTVLNRDGSAIRSEFTSNPGGDWDERHSVLSPDGSVTTFQNSGPTQTVFGETGERLSETVWTSDGPEPEAVVQPAFLGPLGPAAAEKTIEGALTLYTWWASRNVPNNQAVFAFRADAFNPSAVADQPAMWVGNLTKEQVDEACPRHAEVQSITNQAADSTDRGAYESAATYGTAVHQKIREEVNGPTTHPRSEPRDPNFRAEVSLIKSKEADYGDPGTKRVDVLENPGKGTVCVYDVKTGASGLTAARMRELAGTVSFFYPGTLRIIVIEVRPGR